MPRSTSKKEITAEKEARLTRQRLSETLLEIRLKIHQTIHQYPDQTDDSCVTCICTTVPVNRRIIIRTF